MCLVNILPGDRTRWPRSLDVPFPFEYARLGRAATVTVRLFVSMLVGVATLGAEVTPGQVRAWRTRIKQVLFVPDPPPSLAPVSYGSFEPTPGVIAERISYSTEFGMRVPAILYRPSNRGTQKAP